MKLEPIDTSTTEGKIEVMRLASEGRRVVSIGNGRHEEWKYYPTPMWDWTSFRYAIIVEPVGPEEVWLVVPEDDRERYEVLMNKGSAYFLSCKGHDVVRYVRADD